MLLHVFNDMLTAGDTDQISILTLLDIPATFDTIDRDFFEFFKHVFKHGRCSLVFQVIY